MNFESQGEWKYSTNASAFLDESLLTAKYIVGRNEVAEALIGRVNISAIIDDFFAESEWLGVPVVRSQNVQKDSLIVNCSTSIYPVTVQRVFHERGFTNVITLNELFSVPELRVHLPSFSSSMWSIIANRRVEIENILAKLADEESRKTFIDCISFRLYLDPNIMRCYSVRPREQYVEGFMEYKNEIFLDAGGYDGDSSQSFADNYPDYHKII